MATVALDRYGAGSSCSSSTSWSSSSSCSSFSSSSAATTEENSSSSWSSSSSTCSSSQSDVSPSKKKKKKKMKECKKKKEKNRSKSMAVIPKNKKKKKSNNSKSSVGRAGVDQSDDNEVGSMLLLGAELLKEVEEAAASAAAANTAAAAALTDESSRSLEPLPLPIGHYVVQGGPQNRTVLLEQVMSSVPTVQWQAILPPLLKEMNSTELKQLCLQQLQLLSDSTILNIINGDGDQGPACKAVWSETATITGEADRCKKKKSKKSQKKKSKKSKKSQRSGVDRLVAPEPVDEESSGKTLMELLELEMRARAIKALLKKEEEEEEEEEDECSQNVVALDAVSATTPLENDVVQRPLKAGQESLPSDKYKHQQCNSSHQRRPSIDPATANSSQQQLIPAIQQRCPSVLHQETDDAELKRRSRHDNDTVLHKSRQARHYRQRHHERSRSPAVRRTDPSAAMKTELKIVQSPSSRLVKESAPVPVKSHRLEKVKNVQEKGDGLRPVDRKEEEEEQVEYEEDGIQEVDIELGSGSDDDAHSARIYK